MNLTRSQIALVTVAAAMLASFLACGVVMGKIAMDGMARNTPKLAFKNVGWAYRQGNFVEAGKRLVFGIGVLMNTGIRWQFASYFLDRSETLQREGNLADAAQLCLAATETMNSYDFTNVMYRDCMKLYWDAKGY